MHSDTSFLVVCILILYAWSRAFRYLMLSCMPSNTSYLVVCIVTPHVWLHALWLLMLGFMHCDTPCLVACLPTTHSWLHVVDPPFYPFSICFLSSLLVLYSSSLMAQYYSCSLFFLSHLGDFGWEVIPAPHYDIGCLSSLE